MIPRILVSSYWLLLLLFHFVRPWRVEGIDATSALLEAAPLHLNISKFVNNQGFGGGGDFDGLGNHFVCDTPLPMLVGEIPFMPTVNEGLKDNIMARGQVMTLPHERLGALYLLASVNHGPVKTKFVIMYEDGTHSTTTVVLPDWQTGHFTQIVQHDVTTCQVSTGASAGLFSVPIYVDPTKVVSHLTFPYTELLGWFRPALHVFALTAYKAEPSLRIISARSTSRWVSEQVPNGSNRQYQIMTVRVHNTSPYWVENLRIQMDGPLIQTKQFGNIGQLAPGHIQTVDVAIHTIRRTTGNVGVTITLRNANDQLVAASVRTTLKIGLPDYTEDERALRFHEAPTWMQQAKFGIFIHWGVYAVPSWAPVGQAYAEWYWWQMNMGKATREYHENAFGTKFEYDDFLQLWKPTEFDANRLLELIDVSRARYYVFTTKHHDGIALWDTKVTSRSTVQLAPHRDFVKELDTVSKTAFPHLKRGLYYSLPEWYHPSYFDPSLGWRGPPRNAYTGERVPYTGSRPISDYVNELQVPQILELIDTFQPDILWCDIGGINNSTAWQGKFFDDGQQRDQQVSLNDRCGNHISDFSTIEYRAVNIPPPRFWEATRGIDPYSFGYNHATRPDQYASTTSLIVELVNVVTKGGNFLLNIGPDASGKVPDVMANCLREIGQWLDKVNPAIFNSEPYWVTTEDTLEPGQPLRFSQRRDGRAFYVFSLQRPIHRMVVKTVIPLRQQSVIRMMGSAIELRWEVHNNGRLIIVIPSGITNTLEHVWVFEVLL